MSYSNKAQLLAMKYHADQKYGNMPYTQHLFEVEEKCRELFYSGYRTQDQFDVCWLHDILEYTSCTQDDLVAMGFSNYVVSCVSLLTKKDCMDRYNYLLAIVNNKGDYPLAWQTKVADAMCNLTNSIRTDHPVRVERYLKTLNILYGAEQ